MYYNYTHESRVEEVIREILADHKFGNLHHSTEASIQAVADYLDETNLITAWDMRTSDWPNMMGGEAFACWVEDGYLHSWQWTYVF